MSHVLARRDYEVFVVPQDFHNTLQTCKLTLHPRFEFSQTRPRFNNIRRALPIYVRFVVDIRACSFVATIAEKQVTMDRSPRAVSENDIAIVGMSCFFPGADSVEEFWQLLCEGKPMHQPGPKHRFSAAKSWDATGGGPEYWGNFLENVDHSDHRFFGLSSREAQFMDPQRRILLQLAYRTVRSSGYFNEFSLTSQFRCFIGVGAVEYQENVASHPPSVSSAPSTLRAFISRRVSHCFGWNSPSATVDNPCSSSAVAIHLA